VDLEYLVVQKLQGCHSLLEVLDFQGFHYLQDYQVDQAVQEAHSVLFHQVYQELQMDLVLLCFPVDQLVLVGQDYQVYQNCQSFQADLVVLVGQNYLKVHCSQGYPSGPEHRVAQEVQAALEVQLDICGSDHLVKLELVGNFLAIQVLLPHHEPQVHLVDRYLRVVQEDQLDMGYCCYSCIAQPGEPFWSVIEAFRGDVLQFGP